MWIERQFISKINSNALIHPILARVIAARGIDDVDAFLNPSLASLPDPNGFADMALACERIVRAIENDEVIGIFGDYDVDGVTSTTLLWEFLESLGARVVATIPDRIKEGYGLSMAGLERLNAQGVSLVVTVDCGITAHEEVLAAVARGIDVVVIDHHTVAVSLPKAVAVINPHRDDCAREAKYMCAVGVVFNLCIALRRALRERGYFKKIQEPNMRQYLDLVALGTVADVVPLVLDNRVFVRMGLGVIREGKRLGIKALLEVADIKPDKVTASTLGFQLGPRLNAAGRLGDAMQAVKLLRSRDETEAKQIAAQLNESNLSRRELEKQIVEQATQEIMAAPADWVNVVGRSTWHPGVVGIVAARLVEKFGKPAIVVGEGGKGSGRSVPKFHLHEALCEVSDCLQGFGGHAHAVGVHIDLDDIELLRDALNEHAATVLTVDDLQQTILYDGELPLSHIDLALVNTLSAAAPFGRGNAEPVFRINGVTVTDLRELKGGHFKGKLAGGPSFIAFGLGAKAHLMEAPVDMLVVAEVNEWMGRRELQLRVKDIELCA